MRRGEPRYVAGVTLIGAHDAGHRNIAGIAKAGAIANKLGSIHTFRVAT
jgi:hypothetical protein